MLRQFLFVSMIFVVCGCATQPAIDRVKVSDSSQEEQRGLLVGKWFGKVATKDGGKRLQITQRAPDGTYKVRFRVIEPSGKAWEQSEVGYWGVSGGVYFTITRGWLHGERLSEADPTDASLNDAYQILELTQDRFRYRALQSDNEFTLSRVSESFEFPAE